MADRTLKLLGSEAGLASASNVGHAKLVRVLNNTGAVQVITQKNAGGTTLATVTLAAAEVAYIAKASSLLSSFLLKKFSGSSPFTSPPIFTEKLVVSNLLIVDIPLFPASIDSHK